RFIGLARISINAFKGMTGVRELERLVREEGFKALGVSALVDMIPASDRRYYPLYTKAAELRIPVRIYSSMNYANDRPYDLGHPRHLDQVAMDFPELRIIGGLGGWPWVNEMVALVRRHPNLHMDTSAHRAKYLGQPGSGWEMLMQLGNTLIQDKVLAGMGATVVKVEPRDGSPLRRRGPGIAGEDSLYFQSENRGKYSVVAELPELTREPWLAKLLATADAVIEDLGPGRLEAVGLSP